MTIGPVGVGLAVEADCAAGPVAVDVDGQTLGFDVRIIATLFRVAVAVALFAHKLVVLGEAAPRLGDVPV